MRSALEEVELNLCTQASWVVKRGIPGERSQDLSTVNLAFFMAVCPDLSHVLRLQNQNLHASQLYSQHWLHLPGELEPLFPYTIILDTLQPN